MNEVRSEIEEMFDLKNAGNGEKRGERGKKGTEEG